MSDTTYTPTTEEVLAAWIHARVRTGTASELFALSVQFDRWLQSQAETARTVTTVEELNALPLDTVVVDYAGVPRTKRSGNSHMPGGWTHAGNNPLTAAELADGHPMTVAYARLRAYARADAEESK